MNLNETIRELRAEHARITNAIAKLEALVGSGNGGKPTRSRRGRKFMGEAERRAVSLRMQKYWAARRRARGAA